MLSILNNYSLKLDESISCNEKEIELSKFIKKVFEDHYLELDAIYKNSRGVKEIYQKFVDKIYDFLPNFIKIKYSKNILIELTCEMNFISFLIFNFNILKMSINDVESNNQNLLIWGHQLSHKSDLHNNLITAFKSINDNLVIDSYKSLIQTPLILVKIKNPNVNNIRNDIGPIIYTLDISDLREGEGYLSDLSNLKDLAYGFKSSGLKIWSQVIVCMIASTDFDDEIKYPEPSNYLNNEEFVNDYKKCMEDYNKNLLQKISRAKKDFRDFWMNFFNYGDLYPDTSEEVKEETFNKIKFIVCGHIKYPDRIEHIPKFKRIKGDLNKNLSQEIRDGKYCLFKSWTNYLVKTIIEQSSYELIFGSDASKSKIDKKRTNKFQFAEQMD